MSDHPPFRLRLLAIALGLVACATAIALVARGPEPDWLAVAIFGLLFAVTENSAIDLPSGASLSASFLLVMASIVVFDSAGAPLGAMLVGMCAVLFLPQLRAHEWLKTVFNFGAYGLAAWLAALAFFVLPDRHTDTVPGLLVGSIVAAVVFFSIDVFLVSVAVAWSQGEPLRRVAGALRRVHWQVYPFALLGAFLGYLYLHLGPWVVPLFVVPILVARQTFASYLALRAAQEDVTRILIRALEVKDRYTAGHVERVAHYALAIGEELRMSPAQLERLRFAALMHDIGKLVVPNHLLNKPGKLTAKEFARLKQHEHVSVELLSCIEFLGPVASSASGEFTHYEAGQSEKGRPIEPHIVHVADAYDAMTSTRAYRKALSQEIAFGELRKCAGTQFHPQCVEALIGALQSHGEVNGAGHEQELPEYAVPPPDAGTGSAGLGDLAPEPDGEKADAS